MTYVMVDVETDGPIPADYSMICFGAVIVDEALDKRFYGQLQPVSENWIPLQRTGKRHDVGFQVSKKNGPYTSSVRGCPWKCRSGLVHEEKNEVEDRCMTSNSQSSPV